MEKHDIFEFTASNGVVVTAVVVAEISGDYNEEYDSIFVKFLYYAQNRLFTYFEEYRRENAFTPEEKTVVASSEYGDILVEYCILPDYDAVLEAYIEKQNAEEREAIDEWIESVEQEPYEECHV